jgi:nitrogen regulatory protein PII
MLKAGTKILMADGTEKNIENIEIGDEVKTANYNNSVVTGIKTEAYDGELYQVEEKLWCTPQTRIIMYEDEHFSEVVYDAFRTTSTTEAYNGNVYTINVSGLDNSYIADSIKVQV